MEILVGTILDYVKEHVKIHHLDSIDWLLEEIEKIV